MRRLSAIAVLTCAASTWVFAQKQVVMLATVADPTGAPVTTVDASAVTVREDGQPLIVSKVEAIERVPKLQVLIDNGVGVPSTNLSDLRNAIKGLLNVLPAGLEVTLVTTAPQPHFLQKATTSHATLLAAVDRLTPDEHAGKFVDSLYEAAERADKDPLEAAVYTIITVGSVVGDSTVKESDVNKALLLLFKHKIPVFTVLFANISANTGNVQIDVAQAAARQVAGKLDVINTVNRLITLLPEIGKSLAGNLGGGHWFRITADRTSPMPMGHIGVSVHGLTVPDLMLDELRTR
jgi:hypothetical protein